MVLLGPDSDVGRAVLAGQRERARDLLARWRALLPRGGLAVEVVLHGGPEGTPGCRSHAARLLGLADAAGVPAVLSAAVRHAEPGQVRTVDVLDAARRLVVLDSRHLDRVTDAGHLAGTGEMRARALEVTSGDTARADRLLAMTGLLAAECVQDARDDLGIGAVHLPEPEVLGIGPGTDPMDVLAQRCRAAVGRRYPGATDTERQVVLDRLDAELTVVRSLGYPTYFLTVAEVTDLIRARGVRVAARGSGAGSLVNHLLGISGVDPIRHRLLMERFCSPLRAELPDIDVDVESARRTEIYEAVLERFGGERVTCVSMMDTYKVRHAVRDVGAALGMPPAEVDEIAKAFPHIRARDARHAIADLPELRSRGLDSPRLAQFFDLVEALDGLPRHIALHPCGVVLSNAGMLDRTPVEASWLGFPMSQFDKDDVETLGFLKLDVLGIRMQSSMAHAVAEVERVTGERVDLDDEAQVPLDDPDTFELIRTTRTLGMFQIESPGQRELVGKLGPTAFDDLIVDISLFRPGPVKSDMITPFLEIRHGWRERRFLHPSLVPALEETEGVVVFHEQVLLIVAETTGVSLAQADEVRRSMGTPKGQEEVEAWWRPAAAARGYAAEDRDRIWEVLKAFASFGFCKAHAAAFALPTYHSAWLKTHHPAAFLAGILTHDPGMYPKRLLLDDARSFGIPVLGLDVNASGDTYRIEPVENPGLDPENPVERTGHAACEGADTACPVPRRVRVPGVPRPPAVPRSPGGSTTRSPTASGSRSPTSRASARPRWPGSSRASRTPTSATSGPGPGSAGRSPSGSSSPGPSTPSTARPAAALGRRGRVTRRDLLLHVAELDRWERGSGRRPHRSGPHPAAPGRHHRRAPPHHPRLGRPRGGGRRGRRPAPGRRPEPGGARGRAGRRAADPAHPRPRRPAPARRRHRAARDDRGGAGPRRARRPRPRRLRTTSSGSTTPCSPPSGSPAAATCSPPAAGPRCGSPGSRSRPRPRRCAPGAGSSSSPSTTAPAPPTAPSSRTSRARTPGWSSTPGCSSCAGCSGAPATAGSRSAPPAPGSSPRSGTPGGSAGLGAVHAALAAGEADAVARAEAAEHAARAADERSGRRVLVHASGFKQSPYADIKPAGADPRAGRGVPTTPAAPAATGGPGLPSRKLWHASPGSSGH